MSGNWTPGPWETAVERRDDLGCDHIWIAPQTWVPRVARVVVYPDYEAEERANAHLISAAPDLYAALEIVAAELEAMLDAGDVIRGINNAGIAAMRAQVDAARAALAKARGEAK